MWDTNYKLKDKIFCHRDGLFKEKLYKIKIGKIENEIRMANLKHTIIKETDIKIQMCREYQEDEGGYPKMGTT